MEVSRKPSDHRQPSGFLSQKLLLLSPEHPQQSCPVATSSRNPGPFLEMGGLSRLGVSVVATYWFDPLLTEIGSTPGRSSICSLPCRIQFAPFYSLTFRTSVAKSLSLFEPLRSTCRMKSRRSMSSWNWVFSPHFVKPICSSLPTALRYRIPLTLPAISSRFILPPKITSSLEFVKCFRHILWAHHPFQGAPNAGPEQKRHIARSRSDIMALPNSNLRGSSRIPIKCSASCHPQGLPRFSCYNSSHIIVRILLVQDSKLFHDDQKAIKTLGHLHPP